MIRVLIADDHPLVRAGLRQLLGEDPSITAIGEASSGNETLNKLRSGGWNLLLLDINMPDRNGLDILRNVTSSYPETKVLVLSGLSERLYALNVLRAGASGYLAKECAPPELLAAIRTVSSGRRYVGAKLSELLAAGFDAAPEQPAHACLTEREFQVFYKIAGGQSVSCIGDELCLSVKTVSTYRSRILEKMHFSSNADITTYALKNELIH
ncbi:MAG TPA: response regulator transcription factor [Steroidobacteraceae bacterium]|jgi:DNA-binding NarL/FixJ family response regulator